MSVSIFDHHELRGYLRAALDARRAKRGISMNAVSRQLGLRSRASLSLILNGARLPSRDTLKEIADYLELGVEEREYLFLLLELAQTLRKKARAEDAGQLQRQLREFDSSPHDQQTMDESAFSLIADWYHLPFKELIATRGFRWNLPQAVRRMRGKVTEEELFRSMKIMLRLGILERDAKTGRVRRAVNSITTTLDVPSPAIRKHHKQMMLRAIEALEEVDPERREVSSITIGFDSARLSEAKQVLSRFRERFRRRFATSEGDSVVQMNLQFFEHTGPPLC